MENRSSREEEWDREDEWEGGVVGGKGSRREGREV